MDEITDPRPAQSRAETSHEPHELIMPHIDALPGLAEMIDKVELETFARHFDTECEFIPCT